MARHVQIDAEPCATRAICARHARVNDALVQAYGESASPPVQCRDGTYLLEAPTFAVSVRASLRVAHFLGRAVELHAFPTGMHLEAFVASLGGPTMDGELAQHLNSKSKRVVSLTRRARELQQLAEDASASALEARTLRCSLREQVAPLEEKIKQLQAEVVEHQRKWDEFDDFLWDEVGRRLPAEAPRGPVALVEIDSVSDAEGVGAAEDGAAEDGAAEDSPDRRSTASEWNPWEEPRVRETPLLLAAGLVGDRGHGVDGKRARAR